MVYNKTNKKIVVKNAKVKVTNIYIHILII